MADENELRYGLRQEGVLYATRAFAAKLDQAIAFPPKATPDRVAADVLHHMALWDGVIAAAPGLFAAFAYARYRITRQSTARP